MELSVAKGVKRLTIERRGAGIITLKHAGWQARYSNTDIYLPHAELR
jgi:hypothetical protein